MSNSDVIEVRALDEALVVTILKRSLDEPTTMALQDEIFSLTPEARGRPFLLDMSKVDFAPSVAIGALIKMMKAFKLDGQRFLIAAVHPRVLGALSVTQVHKLLEIHKSVDDALAALRKEKKPGE